MKKTYTYILVSLLLGSIGAHAQSSNSQSADFQSKFYKPENETRIHTWWHWVQGAISKQGITADLESMKAQGIVQATILNVGLIKEQNLGVERVPFGSDKWYEMFSWAVEEAARIGIALGAHNCDGWSSSGGPWIKPESSMKSYTWSQVKVGGGKMVKKKLALPFSRDNFYRDVAVIAYPDFIGINSFQSASPQIILNDSINASVIADGNPTSASMIDRKFTFVMKFKKPFYAQKLAILPRKEFMWNNPKIFNIKYNLLYSQDGNSYKKVTDFETVGLNESKEIPFPSISATYFKVEIVDFPWTDSWLPLMMAEMELLAANEKPTFDPNILFNQEKTVFVKAGSFDSFERANDTILNTIDQDKIVDITDKMQADGTLKWNAPAGNWKIIRFGYTTTKAVNAPATKEGEGLECDKMDSNAVAYHFAMFPQKLIDKAANKAGNTFKFILVDSWECNYQNWTQTLPQEFQKRRGYSIVRYIPALCGQAVINSATTEAFLYDFRKTIAELIEQNYYKQLNKLCHKNKVQMHSEIIYGGTGYPPLDVLKSNDYADMPMFEFWVGHNSETTLPEYTPQTKSNLDFPISAALFYNKKVIGAEAYTAMAHYSESPYDIKLFGDRAYTTGINQFILHSYAHQPLTTAAGMTLGAFGGHFNRNNPWFRLSKSWMDYHARIQYLLQQGQMQADILFYTGDQLPSLNDFNTSRIPLGFQAHISNYDILKNKISVKDGKLVFGDVKFSLLVLPDSIGMELATLEQIVDLVASGAMVYGTKPTKPLSMSGMKDKAKFNELVSSLWGNQNEKQYGRGKIYSGISLAEAIAKIGLKPDFEFASNDSSLLFTHRVLHDKDVYFVSNQTNKSIKTELIFRTKFARCSKFDPITGATTALQISATNDGRLKLYTTIEAKEAIFFVFDNTNYEKTPLKHAKIESVEIKDIKANVHFRTDYAAVTPLQLSNLKSLTEMPANEHKYFSGIATYEITFNAPKNYVNQVKAIYLDLGNIGAVATVTLNGVDLGGIWSPNQRLEITAIIKMNNSLKVDVGNEFRNRIIGDLIEYGDLRNIYTTSPIKEFLNKSKPLKPSGLLGPLKLTKEL